ncbi:FAD/NAD(P)-binding protein [Ochrobactrum sp. S46]|nr:FAD/NAD(P)-binding protein [Ochrobactrum sp. S45]MBK0046522.1 FAD/NAD(P)-binding protein [Ochrobactrum sp. S46]
MRKRVAVVGSGPTCIFALQKLITSHKRFDITIFEASDVAGKGTPYQRGINDDAMMSNIPSIEIPHLPQTLVSWLENQPDEYLKELELDRCAISDRAFYPRVVVGDYLRQQFETIVSEGMLSGHIIRVRESCRVLDIIPKRSRFLVKFGDLPQFDFFDYVIAATGHSFPTAQESSPGYFNSPWPATALQSISSEKIGILGTSLSAIDAVMTLATKFGKFNRMHDGQLRYEIGENYAEFEVIMMSRKGLLPEADFYFPIPYENPLICTKQAVTERISLGSSRLLDDVFDLFRQEVAIADPEYAQLIHLDELTVDTFATAYYGVRDKTDPFVWAKSNLDEAKRNYEAKHSIAWRYAILITHEIIEMAVNHFTTEDYARFNQSFKGIFADEYATVPHISIERLLALHEAKRLRVAGLGDQSEIVNVNHERGAVVKFNGRKLVFNTFIDATGQKTLSAADIPFACLKNKGLVSSARTKISNGNQRRTGGIDIDNQCRPLVAGIKAIRGLYLPAVSYLLHKKPFVQGITSAADLGEIVGQSIIDDASRTRGGRMAYRAAKLNDNFEVAA